MKGKNSIFELIRSAEILNNEMILRFMKSFDKNLGIAQILVLNSMRENGPQKQSQLAHALGYTPGAMTNIANKLIKEGYAKREYDPDDRRIVLLAITDAGHDVLLEAQEKGKEMRKNIYAVLEEEEISQLLAIQNKLLKKLRDDIE